MPDLFQQALADYSAHQWGLLTWLVVSVVAGGLVRLCKSDSPIPALQQIPPAWRARLAYVFALCAAAATKLASGMSWQTVVTLALAGGSTAMAGHELLIEGLRGGRELFGPPRGPSSSSKTSSRSMMGSPPPLALLRVGLAFLVAAALLLAGCTPSQAGTAGTLTVDTGVLAACLITVAQAQSPSTNFLAFLAAAMQKCGGSLESILEAVMNSSDPALVAFKAPATEARNDPAKLADLKAKVRAYKP